MLIAAALTACSDDDGEQIRLDASVDGFIRQDSEPSDSAVEPDAEVPVCDVQTGSFWTYDLSVMPPQWVQVPATCRGAGRHVLLFVADEIWLDPMTQQQVDAVVQAFEESTPADPEKGIFQIATEVFGEPTDVDTNDRIYLLYMDIPEYQGNAFDGFIRREDVLGGQNSNNAELLYLDGERLAPDSEYMLGVVAHELVHLIHLNHDTNEESWVEESLAEASMLLCGYMGDLTEIVPYYAQNPSVALVDNSTTFSYGAGFLFGGYLVQRFGTAFITALVEKQSDGIEGIESTLADQGHTETFGEILPDWAAANYLDQPTIEDGRYGYQAFDPPAMSVVGTYGPGESAPSRTVEATGALYYAFDVSGMGGNTTVGLNVDCPAFSEIELRIMVFPASDPSAARVISFVPAAAQDAVEINGVGGDFDRFVVALVAKGSVDVTITAMMIEDLSG